MAEVKMRYYRSQIAGLALTVGDPGEGQIAPETVNFVPHKELYQGDYIKVGYLATDNVIAQRIAKSDPNIVEIKEDEYNQSTDVVLNPRVMRLA